MAWIQLILLLPCFLFSAEFIANVNQNEVGLGESFTLTLTLKDAAAKNYPSIEALRYDFVIQSQQQASNMLMNNGKVSSSITWTLTLMPQTIGEVQIPAIAIDTSQGRIFSQPIRMQITQEKKYKAKKQNEELQITTEASHLNPYKNEPFFLTLKIISYGPIANLQAEKFEVEGAIVEPAGEPIVKENIIRGVKVIFVEFKYLITPLMDGVLKIPAINIQGFVPNKRNRSLFQSGSIFDDNYDPFSLMHGFVNLEPFSKSTEAFEIQIRPPVGQLPWLPATNLTIQENWDGSQTIQEGEVFTRSFVISGEGIHSSQLPSLEGMQENNGQFKVYADKPELKSEILDGKLISQRTENYTLIPQKGGQLTLPEMTLRWWDTEKNEPRETKVSNKILQVSKAPISLHKVPLEIQNTEVEIKTEYSPFLYIVIGVLASLLIIVLAWLVLLQRKLKNLALKPTVSPKPSIPIVKSKIDYARNKSRLNDLNPT